MTNEQITLLIESLKPNITDNEVDNLIEEVSTGPDDRNKKLWANNILAATNLLKAKGNLSKCIVLLKESYDNWRDIYPTDYDLKCEILRQKCLCELENKQMGDAHTTMSHYLYNALKQVGDRHTTPKMHYYSFRVFSDYSLKDIEKEEISLAHPRDFNDPLDTILVWWLEEEIKKGQSGLEHDFKIMMKKAAEHIKIRCMIGSKYENEFGDIVERKVEDLSVLMWAHYANSHTGFCVEYDLDRSKLNTKYRQEEDKVDLIQAIEYVQSIEFEEHLSMEKALFQKSYFWKYENELRLCSFDSTNNEEYPTIPCNGAIKAVYLGVKCSDENRRRMEKAIGNKDIPLFQMSVDETRLTQFKKTQIG